MRRRQDAWLVALAGLHACVLGLAPFAPVIAAGVWWNSNTIAHNFVHRPFFRSRTANAVFALGQSALLGIPQTLWRERHLAHHAQAAWRLRWSARLIGELFLILGTWSALFLAAPQFLLTAYVPGYVAGLGLCALQGYFEHAGSVTISHYGRAYNLLCFNDGYHCEHHAFPGVHWSELPGRAAPVRNASRWPPLLRWLDAFTLNGLERIVLRIPRLQRFLVDAHERAVSAIVPDTSRIRTVAIVGGGLFPRTALVLERLMPNARVVIIDADRGHLDSARAFLQSHRPACRVDSEFRHHRFTAGESCGEFDLVVVPLAFSGDRRRLYENPPAPLVLVHDWCWRARGRGRLVSLLLLKRVNLVVAKAA